MDNEQTLQNAQPVTDPYYTPEDSNKLVTAAKTDAIKEKLYRFFYNIWPSVNRVLSFFLYHLLRIIKGSVKIALEQFRQG